MLLFKLHYCYEYVLLAKQRCVFWYTQGKLMFQKVWFLKTNKHFTTSMVLKECQRPYNKNTIKNIYYYILLKKETFDICQKKQNINLTTSA